MSFRLCVEEEVKLCLAGSFANWILSLSFLHNYPNCLGRDWLILQRRLHLNEGGKGPPRAVFQGEEFQFTMRRVCGGFELTCYPSSFCLGCCCRGGGRGGRGSSRGRHSSYSRVALELASAPVVKAVPVGVGNGRGRGRGSSFYCSTSPSSSNS